MADWRKNAARITDEVVYFEYTSPKTIPDGAGVYVWDIDKTYLDTQFDSLGGLIRTAVEKAFQKRNVPGTGALVRALTSARSAEGDGKPVPIFFVSASPPQMERKIRLKLELDGIRPHGAFFKDNFRNIRKRQFWRLANQVGYKILALLELRMRLPSDVKQVLWGDDSESDAIIYSLYSDICSRRLGEEELREILTGLHVTPSEVELILALQKKVPQNDPVERVYINLASDTDPEYYAKFGRRTLATVNTFQAALDLFQERRLTLEQLQRVAQDMLLNYEFSTDELSQAIEDLVDRKALKRSTVESITGRFVEQKILPVSYKIRLPSDDELAFQWSQNRAWSEWVPSRVDYLNDFR